MTIRPKKPMKAKHYKLPLHFLDPVSTPALFFISHPEHDHSSSPKSQYLPLLRPISQFMNCIPFLFLPLCLNTRISRLFSLFLIIAASDLLC